MNDQQLANLDKVILLTSKIVKTTALSLILSGWVVTVAGVTCNTIERKGHELKPYMPNTETLFKFGISNLSLGLLLGLFEFQSGKNVAKFKQFQINKEYNKIVENMTADSILDSLSNSSTNNDQLSNVAVFSKDNNYLNYMLEAEFSETPRNSIKNPKLTEGCQHFVKEHKPL